LQHNTENMRKLLFITLRSHSILNNLYLLPEEILFSLHINIYIFSFIYIFLVLDLLEIRFYISSHDLE
jgi:hypothetical protein